jgi:hypothetical protein
VAIAKERDEQAVNQVALANDYVSDLVANRLDEA